MASNEDKFSGLGEGIIFILENDVMEIITGERAKVRNIKKITPRAKFENGPKYNAVEQKNGGKELIISEDAIVYLAE